MWLKLDTLRDKLEHKGLLGPELRKAGIAAEPPSRYRLERGDYKWTDNEPFATVELFKWLLPRFKPQIAAPQDPPIGSRLTMSIKLKGKTAYLDLPEYKILARDAFHLNAGHEITHALACRGGWSGKALFLLELLLFLGLMLIVPILLNMVYPHLLDTSWALCSALLGILITFLTFVLVPNTNRRRGFERTGSLLSYDREEVVAEIGACLLYAKAGGIDDWPDWSVKKIASRLSAAEPEHRERVLVQSFAEACRRLMSLSVIKEPAR